MDPRSERSRAALREALTDLIRERDYETINIQDITDRADTARVTFYRHYSNKDELLLDFLAALYEWFAAQLDAEAHYDELDFNNEPPTLRLFEFVGNDRELYRRLMNGTTAALLETQLRLYITEQIRQGEKINMTEAETHFLASAVIGNLKWWLSQDAPPPALAAAQSTYWLSISGILAMRGELHRVTMPHQQPSARR